MNSEMFLAGETNDDDGDPTPTISSIGLQVKVKN